MLSPRPHLPASPESTGGSGGARATLDAEALERLGALDPSGANRLLERVLTTFQTSAVRLGLQLTQAHGRADHDAIRHVAHTLKSSSAAIGALTLAAQCAEVETAIRLDDKARLDTGAHALSAELDAALLAIEHMLAERRP
jgi:HPt (histidine-containing phosphotransfer) domain-containing protein